MERNRAFVNSMDNIPLLRRAMRHQVLPLGLREHFLTQLAAIEERWSTVGPERSKELSPFILPA
jgi:hypothetical protein